MLYLKFAFNFALHYTIMDKIELELLNEEYSRLMIRIKKVRNLILKNGGLDPADEEDKKELETDYPFKKTLMEKIKFILKENEFKQLTATQITILMMKYEPSVSKQSITQLCSNMGKDGKIGVVHGQKNLYYHSTFNVKGLT